MEARIAAFALLLLAGACAMPGEEDPNESFWGSFYSYGKSDEEKEKGWWDGFYGKKPEGDNNCSFYNTCKKDSGGWGSGTGGGDSGGWYGGGSGSSSHGGSDAGHDSGGGW